MENEEKKGDSSRPHRLKVIHSCQIKLCKSITWNLTINRRRVQVKINPIPASEKTASPFDKWLARFPRPRTSSPPLQRPQSPAHTPARNVFRDRAPAQEMGNQFPA